jgi:hypothetical protein
LTKKKLFRTSVVIHDGTDQHDEDQQQTEKGLTWDPQGAIGNVRSLYRPGGLRITINGLKKYKIAKAVIQETRWNK